MRGVKKADSPAIKGFQIYHNFFRPRMGLKGKISSELGSRDKELERKAQLTVSDIVEQAAYSYSGNFLFDAT